MSIPRVKICGVKHPRHAQAAWRAGAAALGLNFFPASSRYIGGVENARALMQSAPPSNGKWAGVFVNESLASLEQIQSELKLDILQLHGNETPEFVCGVKHAFPQAEVWKAFRVATREDLKTIPDFACDGWLLDAKVAGLHGGAGVSFDWSILDALPRSTTLILSGGLNPNNVAEAIRQVRPNWVDIASGVEISPGEKSVELIEAFLKNVTGCATKVWPFRNNDL